jgi:hypothetical protein
VLILKEVKAFCFDAVLQVLILTKRTYIAPELCNSLNLFSVKARDTEPHAGGLATDLPKARASSEQSTVKKKELEWASLNFDSYCHD